MRRIFCLLLWMSVSADCYDACIVGSILQRDFQVDGDTIQAGHVSEVQPEPAALILSFLGGVCLSETLLFWPLKY
jgi:hypothetical protein